MSLSIIILAAGFGRRMRTSLPKVLLPLAGVPMLERVVKTAQALSPDHMYVIYGNGGDRVRNDMAYLPVTWIEQTQALGTGHAVQQALPYIDDEDQVLILYGDVPLISVETLTLLLKNTPKNAVGIVVAEFANPTGFGRIIRNEMGNIIAIVEEKDATPEEKDATPEEKEIREINTGIVTTSAQHLKKWLPKLTNDNKQGEYYLTDIIATAENEGYSIGGLLAHCPEEVSGVNNLCELAKLERYYQQQQATALMQQGTILLDPHRLDIRGELIVDKYVTIDVNVIIEGKVHIGKNVKIGPNTLLRDAIIGNDVEIKANCMIEETQIGDRCVVGPFARLRPGTVLAENVKVGNFVEVKNTRLGEDSKASHLSYLGDASIGARVNIGAGTITCNYDGANKHHTIIEDGVFIGSDTQLIAPVKVGKEATIGAGSTITQDAPAGQLTVARARQKSIEGWKNKSNN